MHITLQSYGVHKCSWVAPVCMRLYIWTLFSWRARCHVNIVIVEMSENIWVLFPDIFTKLLLSRFLLSENNAETKEHVSTCRLKILNVLYMKWWCIRLYARFRHCVMYCNIGQNEQHFPASVMPAWAITASCLEQRAFKSTHLTHYMSQGECKCVCVCFQNKI